MGVYLYDTTRYHLLVDNLNKLLSHIENIFNSYKEDLIKEEELIRIEKFHRYDRHLIDKTFKNPKLLTSLDSSIYPKEIYSYQFVDNIDIYENRFIISLLERIKLELYQTLNNKATTHSFLRLGISYGNYGTNTLLKRVAYDSLNNEIKLFETNVLNRINLLLKRNIVTRIKRISLNDIIPTNLLIDDRDYSYCYYFFLNKNNEEAKLKSDLINKLKSKFKNDISINKIKNSRGFIKDGYKYIIKFKDDIDISISIPNCTTLNYNLSFNLDYFNSQAIIKHNNNKKTIEFNKYEDILDLIDSLVIAFKDSDNFLCPLCNSKLNNLVCPKSMASYIKANNKLYLHNSFMMTYKED